MVASISQRLFRQPTFMAWFRHAWTPSTVGSVSKLFPVTTRQNVNNMRWKRFYTANCVKTVGDYIVPLT